MASVQTSFAWVRSRLLPDEFDTETAAAIGGEHVNVTQVGLVARIVTNRANVDAGAIVVELQAGL